MGALPKKMAELGHEVWVMMPKKKCDKIPVKFLEAGMGGQDWKAWKF